MDKNTQAAINAHYDALMFATSRDAARKAARELVNWSSVTRQRTGLGRKLTGRVPHIAALGESR